METIIQALKSYKWYLVAGLALYALLMGLLSYLDKKLAYEHPATKSSFVYKQKVIVRVEKNIKKFKHKITYPDGRVEEWETETDQSVEHTDTATVTTGKEESKPVFAKGAYLYLRGGYAPTNGEGSIGAGVDLWSFRLAVTNAFPTREVLRADSWSFKPVLWLDIPIQ